MITPISTQGLLFTGSIMLHLLFLSGFWRQVQHPIAVPTEHVTRLSVGFIAARAGASSQAQHTNPPEKAAKPAIQSIQQPRVVPRTERKIHVNTVLKHRVIEPKNPAPPRQSEPKHPPEPVKQTQPASIGNQGIQGGQISTNKAKETGIGQQQGGQNNNQAHDLAVRKHLLSRQQTPHVLGQRQGTVIVEFMIDRQGRLVKQLIGKSSGIREFDRAARQLVLQASPYPQAPADATWEQRHYRIQVHYSTE
jgi:protein TonB